MSTWLKIIGCLIVICHIGCGKIDPNIFSSGIKKGIITYDLSFPYLTEDQLQIENLLPDEMIYTFKENESQSSISSIGFKTVIHSLEETKELNHYVKVLSKKLKCTYDEIGVKQLLDSYPDIHIIKTNQTDTLAGILCKKAIGVFKDISKPSIDIYYTN